MEVDGAVSSLDLARDLAAEIFAPLQEVITPLYRFWAEGMTTWAIAFPLLDGGRPATLDFVSRRLHDYEGLETTLLALETHLDRDGEDETGGDLGTVVRDIILILGPGEHDLALVAGIAARAVDDHIERLPSLCSPAGLDPALVRHQLDRWRRSPEYGTALRVSGRPNVEPDMPRHFGRS